MYICKCCVVQLWLLKCFWHWKSLCDHTCGCFLKAFCYLKGKKWVPCAIKWDHHFAYQAFRSDKEWKLLVVLENAWLSDWMLSEVQIPSLTAKKVWPSVILKYYWVTKSEILFSWQHVKICINWALKWVKPDHIFVVVVYAVGWPLSTLVRQMLSWSHVDFNLQ